MPDARTAHLRLLAATVTSRCITSTAPTAPTDSAPPPPRTPSTRTRLDERESRERVQCLAMGAAGAANLSRRQLHQGRARLFHRHGTDHGAAFVAGDVGLVPTHLHNEAATAIRPDRLVRDNQEPSLSRATVGIISRRGAPSVPRGRRRPPHLGGGNFRGPPTLRGIDWIVSARGMLMASLRLFRGRLGSLLASVRIGVALSGPVVPLGLVGSGPMMSRNVSTLLGRVGLYSHVSAMTGGSA